MRLNNKKTIHFVGIGGIGMSGIAKVLLQMGYKVSGSDLEPNELARKIGALGARLHEGHRRNNIPEDAGLVVHSSSIPKDNPELEEARKRGIRIAHRAEVLGELFNKKKGIAITGTHGKTTTTSLISVILKNCGLDPTVIIGGEVDEFKGNAEFGRGAYLVAEADESDSSFLRLLPYYAVITNIEMEHMDHYKTLDDVMASYGSFIGNLKKGGIVFYNASDAYTKKILRNFKGRVLSFALTKDADIYAADIKMSGFNTSFKCIYKNRSLGKVDLKIPGAHNVTNALAAVGVGLNLGLDFKDIANSIRHFEGPKRRFQLRCETGGVMLIDDYAHHPTEIRAVLEACRNWKDKRIIAVFQPHRYSRTKFLADEFVSCFNGVHKLILTDIYAASERAIKGVSVKNIYDRAKAGGIEDVEILKKKDIAKHVMRLKRPDDMILVLGAGDIKKVADELANRLSAFGDLVCELKKRVRGKIITELDLRSRTSFKIGGPADIWVEPDDAKDLERVLKFAGKNKIKTFIMGNGSNLLANDSGFRGIIIHLGSPYFKSAKISGRTIKAGAGFSLPELVRLACDQGLGGLESLVGIPGTLGGAIYMNAGGSANPIYKNIGDIVRSLKVMDRNGNVRSLKRGEIKFGYRSSGLDSYIILEAALRLDKSDKEVLASSCSRFLKMKKEKHPIDVSSAGCVFKNPSGFQFTCGQMIDMLGLKGKSIGGAQISEKHANFIVNRSGATYKDVMELIALVKDKVKENYGIPLELEIKII